MADGGSPFDGALVHVRDHTGRLRGTGFVADRHGTVVTSHEAVAGLPRLLLHATGGRRCPVTADAITPLPARDLALIRTRGLDVLPLPIAVGDLAVTGTYVRLPAGCWREARVLGTVPVAYETDGHRHLLDGALELAIGTTGRDALRPGGGAAGGPVLDARTGTVVAVLGTRLRSAHGDRGFAVPLTGTDGPIAALLAENAVTVPARSFRSTGQLIARLRELTRSLAADPASRRTAGLIAETLRAVPDARPYREALRELAEVVVRARQPGSASAAGERRSGTNGARGGAASPAGLSAEGASSVGSLSDVGSLSESAWAVASPPQVAASLRALPVPLGAGAEPPAPVAVPEAEFPVVDRRPPAPPVPAADPFAPAFWCGLALPVADRLDLLRCLLPADGPARHPDGPARHPDGPARHPDGPARYPDGPARYPDGPARHPDGPARHSDGPARYPDGPARHSDGPARHSDGPARYPDGPARFLDAVSRALAADPTGVQPSLVRWFDDERPLPATPHATVADAAQALLHTHRRRAPDDLTEALVDRPHRRADELLAALAEDEPSALCRAVDRWAHDERPARRVAAVTHGLRTAPHARTDAQRALLRHAALALLARADDPAPHGGALALLARDPRTRARHLPDALRQFAAGDPGVEPTALLAALTTHPEPVLDAFRQRLSRPHPGPALRALADVTAPPLTDRIATLVREAVARRPETAPDVAAHIDRRLDRGPAARAALPRATAPVPDGPGHVRRVGHSAHADANAPSPAWHP